MEKITIDGQTFNEYKIRYYAVDGNPYHKVWGRTKKEAQGLAPEGAKLVLVQTETRIESA